MPNEPFDPKSIPTPVLNEIRKYFLDRAEHYKLLNKLSDWFTEAAISIHEEMIARGIEP